MAIRQAGVRSSENGVPTVQPMMTTLTSRGGAYNYGIHRGRVPEIRGCDAPHGMGAVSRARSWQVRDVLTT